MTLSEGPENKAAIYWRRKLLVKAPSSALFKELLSLLSDVLTEAVRLRNGDSLKVEQPSRCGDGSMVLERGSRMEVVN